MIIIISRIIRNFIAWILLVITWNKAQIFRMNVGSRIFNISLFPLINNYATYQDMVNFLYIHLLWTMHLWEYCIHYTWNFNLRCIHYIHKDTIESSLVFSNLISTYQDMVDFLYVHLLWTMHLWEFCIHYTWNFNLRCIHCIHKDTT